MKRNTIILLVILIILAAVAYFFTREKDVQMEQLLYERSFAIKDAGEVTRILIAHRNGTAYRLSKSGGHWKVNDEYRVFDSSIRNLLRVIKNVEIKYMPPNAARETIMKDMIQYGIKVEIYTDSDTPIKVYYLGGVPSDERGTYGIMEGSDQPFPGVGSAL